MANNFESKFTTLKVFMKSDVTLRLGSDNKSANSGEQAHRDIPRSKFIINGKEISTEVIKQLYKKHESLDPNLEKIKKDYRPFAREIFKEMFIEASAPIPVSSILDEMVTNCHQAGYENIYRLLLDGFCKHNSHLNISDKKIYINCENSDSINFECSSNTITVIDFAKDSECDISFSIKFTLASDQNKIRYRNGEMHLVFPEELKIGDQTNRNLIDIIKEIFYELVEKFFGRCQVKEEGNIVKMTSKLKDGPLNSLSGETTDDRHDAKNSTTEVTNKTQNNALSSSVLEDVQPLTNDNDLSRNKYL